MDAQDQLGAGWLFDNQDLVTVDGSEGHRSVWLTPQRAYYQDSQGDPA